MNYKIIDLEHYPRKNHFEYFLTVADPYVGVTVEVDITDFIRTCKENGLPFFLSFLYCAGNAANSVPELRQRIIDKKIVEFEHCNTSHTELRGDGTYGYCQINPALPFTDFLTVGKAAQEKARNNDSLEDEDPLSLFFVSSLPWISYIQVTQPTPRPADSNPRITWGKYHEANGKTVIPVTLLANHALVDGLHMSHFYKALDEQLVAFVNEHKSNDKNMGIQ